MGENFTRVTNDFCNPTVYKMSKEVFQYCIILVSPNQSIFFMNLIFFFSRLVSSLKRLPYTFLLPVAFFCQSVVANAQYEKVKEQIDSFYYLGQYEKAGHISDSIEPFVRRDYGPASLYYGVFVSEYQGLVYDKAGDYKNAELMYKKGMQIIKDAAGENQYTYAETCINIGNMYYPLALYNPALDYTIKGRQLLRALKLTNTEAYASGTDNLANIYAAIGQYDKSENFFDTTLAVIDLLAKINPAILTRKFEVFNNRAVLYSKIADFEKADYYFKKAIKIGKTFLKKTNLEFNKLLNNYGLNLKNKGQLQSAQDTLQEVKNNLDKGLLKNSNLYIAVTANIIEILRDQGKLDSCLLLTETAIHDLEKYKSENPAEYNVLLVNYARTLMSFKKWEKAGSILDEILKDLAASNDNANAQVKSKALYYLAYLYLHTAKYNQAVTLADSLYSFIENTDLKNYDVLPENDKMALLSFIYQVQMIYPAAFYGAGMKDTGLLEKIYRIHTIWKGLLLEKQSVFMTDIRSAKNKQLYSEWMSNRKFLYEQYKLPVERRNNLADSIAIETDKIEQQLNRERLLDLANPPQMSAKNTTQKNKLAKDECIIEFFHFASADTSKPGNTIHYGAFLTTKEQTMPRWIYLCTEKELTDVLNTRATRVIRKKDFSQLFIDPRLRIPGKIYPCDKLYGLLWKPLAPFLTGIKKVNCISEGIITQLPLHALPINEKQFLADKFSFRYLLSERSFNEINDAETNEKTISLWGGVSYTIKNKSHNGDTWSGKKGVWRPIKWSGYEIKEIRKILTPSFKCNVYTGAAASEENFRRASDSITSGILHISTHGFFTTHKLILDEKKNIKGIPYLWSQNPLLNCGLVMAGANDNTGSAVNSNNDGILAGYEIATLPFDHTGLVVLSACETGLGNIWESESVFGLQRAFKLAGVHKIIMSLWQVPDRETSELMIAFYKLLVKGKAIEAAFEQAQKIMRKKYPSPYYWAGFMLVE